MAKKRGKGRCGCVVTVGTTTQDDASVFDLHRTGWGQAKRAAMALAKDTDQLALVNIRCEDGSMPVYQCTYDRRKDRMSCVVEEFGPDESPRPVAGLADLASRKGSKKRKKARDKKKKGPLTPQQKKFKEAASVCKGSPDYRGCVATQLRK